MSGDLAARLQFAAAAITHGLFASTTIGLITVIAVAQTLGLRRGDAGLTALARAAVGHHLPRSARLVSIVPGVGGLLSLWLQRRSARAGGRSVAA